MSWGIRRAAQAGAGSRRAGAPGGERAGTGHPACRCSVPGGQWEQQSECQLQIPWWPARWPSGAKLSGAGRLCLCPGAWLLRETLGDWAGRARAGLPRTAIPDGLCARSYKQAPDPAWGWAVARLLGGSIGAVHGGCDLNKCLFSGLGGGWSGQGCGQRRALLCYRRAAFTPRLLTTRPTDHMVEGTSPKCPQGRSHNAGVKHPQDRDPQDCFTQSYNQWYPGPSPDVPVVTFLGELRRYWEECLDGGPGGELGDNRWKQSPGS